MPDLIKHCYYLNVCMCFYDIMIKTRTQVFDGICDLSGEEDFLWRHGTSTTTELGAQDLIYLVIIVEQRDTFIGRFQSLICMSIHEIVLTPQILHIIIHNVYKKKFKFFAFSIAVM